MRDRFERLLDIKGAAEIRPEWPSGRIAELGAHDMADLHLSTPPQLHAQTGLNRAELLGVLYVLEDSRSTPKPASRPSALPKW